MTLYQFLNRHPCLLFNFPSPLCDLLLLKCSAGDSSGWCSVCVKDTRVQFSQWFCSKWNRSVNYWNACPLFLPPLHISPLTLYISSHLLDKLIWLMLVNPVLSLGTDLAHIAACSYHISNLGCTETVDIYCCVLSQLPPCYFFPLIKLHLTTNTAGDRQGCSSHNSKKINSILTLKIPCYELFP